MVDHGVSASLDDLLAATRFTHGFLCNTAQHPGHVAGNKVRLPSREAACNEVCIVCGRRQQCFASRQARHDAGSLEALSHTSVMCSSLMAAAACSGSANSTMPHPCTGDTVLAAAVPAAVWSNNSPSDRRSRVPRCCSRWMHVQPGRGQQCARPAAASVQPGTVNQVSQSDGGLNGPLRHERAASTSADGLVPSGHTGWLGPGRRRGYLTAGARPLSTAEWQRLAWLPDQKAGKTQQLVRLRLFDEA